MTNEEKARAYDEALERARKMLNMILDNELLGFPDQIREIFPQLKESKDEKIRKEMIRYFTEMKKGGSASLPYDDCITYLKRLKEYEITEEDKKIIPEALVMLCDDIINHRVHTPIKTDEEGARKIKAFLKTFNRQPYKTREEWEKQKEPQHAIRVTKGFGDPDGPQFELVDIQEEQKPWSEEDEKNLKSVVSTLWFALNTPHFPLNYERIIELEGWLKSLRPSWKPSEQEKGALRTAISVLTEERSFPEAAANVLLTIAKKEIIKDLPMWKIWENGACGNSDGIPIAIVKRGIDYKLVSSLGIQGEQYIMLSDLEKLPGFNVLEMYNPTCGTSTATLHGNTSATDGKEHNPSFTD